MAKKEAKESKQQISVSGLWDDIRFDQEKHLSQRLQKMMHLDLLMPIFKKSHYTDKKDYWRSIYEGHCFRLTKSLAPKMHEMCQHAKTVLGFDEPVEFFVNNDSTVNAVSYLRESEEHSHLIVFNSGLIESLNEKETLFIIGHELGHIIFKTSELRRFIHDLFPEGTTIPIPVLNLITLWDKFAEISADRLGYIVSPGLETAVTIFFKLSSGLGTEKVNFNVQNYLSEIDTILSNFSQSEAMFQGTHPTNPIRVKAIQLFHNSSLYKDFSKNGKIKADSELSKQMDELANLIELHPNNERDHYRLVLIAAAGMFMAGLDNEITPAEEEKIVEYLANFTINPRVYLQSLIGDIKSPQELFKLIIETTQKLLAIDPEERYPMFRYLCSVAISDREIKESEVEFLMDLGTKVMGMHEIELSRMIVQVLREEGFQPKL